MGMAGSNFLTPLHSPLTTSHHTPTNDKYCKHLSDNTKPLIEKDLSDITPT